MNYIDETIVISIIVTDNDNSTNVINRTIEKMNMVLPITFPVETPINRHKVRTVVHRTVD